MVQNVNVMLEQHVTENAEVALTLSRLTEERQRLQARIKELEEQLKTAHRSQVKTSGITLLLSLITFYMSYALMSLKC
jgi:ABC-type lipoprotein export system ATPase subunit